MGVRGEALSWFSSYLTDRSIATEVTDEKVPIEYGAPQGSILGPTLFLIYVNDLYRLFNTPINNVCCGLCHKSYSQSTLVFTPDSREELIAFAENTTLGAAAPVAKSENFPWTWDHSKIKAFISFPYPPSFIFISDLPLYMLLFVCVDVHIFPRYLLLFTIFMRKRHEFSSRLRTLLLTSSKLKIFMFYLYLRWHINSSREISHVVFRDCLN